MYVGNRLTIRGCPVERMEKQMTMKWKKLGGPGELGAGYMCGEYKVTETHNYDTLAETYGGRQKDYYWKLEKNGEILKYAGTAKALKAYAETLDD